MTYNTNRHARKLRKALGPQNQYKASPWQWGYVAAVHAAASTTLSSPCTAGQLAIETAAPIETNAFIVVGNGGPVEVAESTGTGPYTVTLNTRGVPNSQPSGTAVRILATVDLYLDGWQNPPENLPPGVGQTLTTGVRFISGCVPIVGQVGIMARGTGLQRSDRLYFGPPATQSPVWLDVGNTVGFNSGWSDYGFPYHLTSYRRVGDMVQLRGAASTTDSPPSTVFTLPPGYRPQSQVTFTVVSSTTGSAVYLDIKTDGEVVSPAPAGNASIYLDGVAFSILS